MRLAVELYDTLLGHLDGADARSFDVALDDGAAQRFGPNSRVLSVLMPLTRVFPRQHAGRRRNWFAELLPEGDQLDHLLAQAGIRRGDTLRFLAAYGRDIAGALQIWDVDDPTEPKTPATRSVDDAQIRRLRHPRRGVRRAARPHHRTIRPSGGCAHPPGGLQPGARRFRGTGSTRSWAASSASHASPMRSPGTRPRTTCADWHA